MSRKLIFIGFIGILALTFMFAQCGRDKNNPIAPIRTTAKIQVDETDPLAPIPYPRLGANVTATGQLIRTWPWTLENYVTPTQWDLFKGDKGTSEFTVTAIKGNYADSISVSGTITVTNISYPWSLPYSTEDLTIYDDILYSTGGVQYQVLKTIPVSTAAKPILANSEAYSYPYEVKFAPVQGATYKNRTRITITNYPGYPGMILGPTSEVAFATPTTLTSELYNSITVTNKNGETWANVTATSEWNYTRDFTAAGTYQDTVIISGTQQSAIATVAVNLYELTVTQDAVTSYDRRWNWNIAESADQISLLFAVGEQLPVNYTVTVNANNTDDNRVVSGNITVHNPAPIAATINSITNLVSPGIAANIDFGGASFPYSLVAGGDLSGSYSAELPDLTNRTSTATATLQNYSYDKDLNATPSGTTNFAHSTNVAFGNPAVENDECVNLSDTYPGSNVNGTICATEVQLPKNFTYSRNIGPYEACGDYTINNTASFITNDTQTRGSASWTVAVAVPCGGCTKPIAYWKSHTIWGPKTYDEIWDKKNKGNAEFLDTGYTYYEVLMMSVKGGNAYVMLAQRYIAAELNKLNSAHMSFEVFTTFTQAKTLLVSYQYTMDISKKTEDRDLAMALSTILDNYNGGLMGTPACQ